MRSSKQMITAGVLTAALGISPNLVGAQTSGTSSTGTSSQSPSEQQSQPPATQGQTTTPSSSSQTTTQSSSQSAADQEAARQHLAAARQALADITKLPAAAQLQGEQRTQISTLITAFNAFATATTDWRSKYEAVDQQLNQLLGAEATSGSTATTPSTTGTAGTSGTTGATAGAAASGSATLDPTIMEKLRTVRKELDEFELASGDPTPHIKAIAKILDSVSGTGGAAVGTSGTTAAAGASGSVTLTSAQVDEIRKHLEALRAAANR